MIDLNVGNSKLGELSSESEGSSDSAEISDEEVAKIVEEQKPKTAWSGFKENMGITEIVKAVD